MQNTFKKAFIIKGKSGQERIGGKKEGGVVINLNVPPQEAETLLFGIYSRLPNKLKDAMFSYGLNAEAQEAVGYEIPSATPWIDSKTTAIQHDWTAENTADYFAAVDAYEALERERGGGGKTHAAVKKEANIAAVKTLLANGLTWDMVKVGYPDLTEADVS
jgi:hypothetical protein